MTKHKRTLDKIAINHFQWLKLNFQLCEVQTLLFGGKKVYKLGLVIF